MNREPRAYDPTIENSDYERFFDRLSMRDGTVKWNVTASARFVAACLLIETEQIRKAVVRLAEQKQDVHVHVELPADLIDVVALVRQAQNAGMTLDDLDCAINEFVHRPPDGR